jgi:hypothetical protein
MLTRRVAVKRTALLLPILFLGSAPPASAAECLSQVDALIVEFELPASPEFTQSMAQKSAPLPKPEPAARKRRGAPDMSSNAPMPSPEAESPLDMPPSSDTMPMSRDTQLGGRYAEPGFGRLGPHMQPDKSFDVSHGIDLPEVVGMPSSAPILPPAEVQKLKAALYEARQADALGQDERCRSLLGKAKQIASTAKPRQ